MDYGAATATYLDEFIANIEWAKVYERYQAAVHGASEPFAADPGGRRRLATADVRCD